MINISSNNMLDKILSPEGDVLPFIPTEFLTNFPNIVSDPEIHAGLPHIKGTRILALNVFRAQVKGYTVPNMLMDFKAMGIKVTEAELKEAFSFMLKWLEYANGEDAAKTSK